MNTVKCNAKDPSSCRYHRPDAGQLAKQELDTAREVYDATYKASNGGSDYNQVWRAKEALKEAENTYYVTEAGIADLEQQIAAQPDEDSRFELMWKKTDAEYRKVEIERKNAIDEEHGGPLIPTEDDLYSEASTKKSGNHLWPETTGSKYDPSLRASQIKVLVNKDIKDAQRAGHLPRQLKFAVRASRNHLSLRIIGAGDAQIFNDAEEKARHDMTDEAKELRRRAQNIVYAYNHEQYDQIEGRTNSTNFYSDVDFESSWEKESRQRKADEKLAAKSS